ncbi:isoprenylcysteine carboxylmethyltransferase family protein [Actinotalea sp. M2MS4P-6]|uniref:methyltransferase family protein n=1 Tax=Actinotalea sp. M2MS4P-6 TaxID=2983762 RepID=UPI0021E4C7B7|nr:isoprenylcysteine carboxylmethyltransferase family protein [Actinotalea sp. M2MS4P-6]MCV2392966.1 isoprenylcysteine carboxylmethyltransferase family protein [Actinotalea sp. M2MS4P-6]
MPRLLLRVVPALGWVGFAFVTVWTMVFLTGRGLPRTVDGPHRVGTTAAVATDLGLLLLFAVQHTVMARRGFKARLRIPPALERSAYVLATDVVLAVLLVCWQPFGGRIWHVEGPPAAGLWLLYAAGCVLAIAATFAVDHYELMGLRQAGWFTRSGASSVDALHVGGLHALVRHPLMTGLLVTVWATPSMGASHLLYASGASLYIWIGTWFEERDLRRAFGTAYDAYAARVPAIVPRLGSGVGR